MKVTDKCKWMKSLDENLRLDQLSIPGTHDSGTSGVDDVFKGVARTQNFDIITQLRDGIRFFDIRVQSNIPNSNDLNIYHGPVSCNLSFNSVLDDCKSFLDYNPTETILMLINSSQEGVEGIDEIFDIYLDKYNNLFYLGHEMPTLKNARGHIVLLRRFNGTRGINLSSGWLDNSTFKLITDDEQVFYIEDEYRQHDTHKKMASVENSINRAVLDEKDKVMYITYNSISAKGHTPYQYAWGGGIGKVDPKLNIGLIDFLRTKTGHQRLGIIVMDFYNNKPNNLDNSAVELIIDSNSRP